MTMVCRDALFPPLYEDESFHYYDSDEEGEEQSDASSVLDPWEAQEAHQEACDNWTYKRRVGPNDLQPRVFRRLVDDMKITFGDGGEASLDFPVLACPALEGISPECLQRTTAGMARLAAKRKDVQQNGIVEDIVDPELFPRLLGSSRASRTISKLKTGTVVPSKLMASPNRGSYAWLPSRVVLGDDGVYRFASPINNLPQDATNATLYADLEQLLTSLMPALIDRGAEKRPDGGYNVVVKLQRYKIPAGVAYSGQWHTEGVTENVSAAGVVYVDWPEELVGGALKFRPPELPDHLYRIQNNFSLRRGVRPVLGLSVGGQRGSSVVFSNTVPHRFETLTNMTDATLTRSFVNFFVTDPALESTAEIPPNLYVNNALINRLNYDLVREVLEWLHFTPITRADALELRSKAKAEMLANKGRWGENRYGNCGYVKYIAGDFAKNEYESYEEDMLVNSHFTSNSSAPSLHEK